MARYAFSDLHGNYNLWRQLVARVQPDDELYCLGDIIDRGENGFKICLELWQRPHTYFIKGNHEMMAIEAIPWLVQGQNRMNVVDNWMWNGGGKTWDDICEYYKNLSDENFNTICNNIINLFKGMKDRITLLNDSNQLIILSHAGFTLGKENHAELGWDREHFWDEWPKDYTIPNTTPIQPSQIFLIHGHTPVQFLQRALELGYIDSRVKVQKEPAPAVINYCDGHKFDIDLGTIISNRVALFNLDTFEVIYLDE